MSKVHKEKIECAHCKAKGMFDIWDSMNVDLDPELREKVFNDEPFYILVRSVTIKRLYHSELCITM